MALKNSNATMGSALKKTIIVMVTMSVKTRVMKVDVVYIKVQQNLNLYMLRAFSLVFS